MNLVPLLMRHFHKLHKKSAKTITKVASPYVWTMKEVYMNTT